MDETEFALVTTAKALTCSVFELLEAEADHGRVDIVIDFCILDANHFTKKRNGLLNGQNAIKAVGLRAVAN